MNEQVAFQELDLEDLTVEELEDRFELTLTGACAGGGDCAAA